MGELNSESTASFPLIVGSKLPSAVFQPARELGMGNLLGTGLLDKTRGI